MFSNFQSIPNTNRSIVLFLLLLLAATPLRAQDRVLLRNGDVVSGQIVEENDKQIYLRSKTIGMISVQTQEIEKIERTTVEEHDENLGAALTDPIDPADLIDLLPRRETAPESKWSGQAGLSMAMRESTKYNSSGMIGDEQNESYRVHGNLAWKANQDRLDWDWSYRYSRDEYGKQDDFLNISQNYSHDFWENFYAKSKTVYQQDYRRAVEHEYLQTAEMGIKWFSNSDFELSTSAGGGFHKYERTNQSSKPDEELSITFDQSMRWKIVNSLTLIQKYTHLGDLTNYHFVFTAGLENKLLSAVFVRMEYRLDEDTGIDNDNYRYRDKALLTSLLYKF